MELHVLSNPISGPGGPVQPASAELASVLRGAVRGQVRFGEHDRNLYSTDASMYQQVPIGVVVPVDEADVVRAVEVCFERGVAILPRGGGTSLAGQCTNEAVVIDTSANLREVRDIDAAAGTVYAQAGVAIDEINNELARHGIAMFYAPDPATTAQATVGGTIGNNAAGARSVKYGRTVDSVLAVDAVLCSGARVRFEPGAGGRDPIALKLADGVMGIVKKHERQIRERFPKTLRRNAGYALDMILAQMDRGVTAQELNLVPLLCGSEGTLAVTLGARLRLFPQPRARALGLLSFATVDEAIGMVRAILETGPSAVELVDDVVIEAAIGNLECAQYVKAFPLLADGRSPGAVLYVEYHLVGEGGDVKAEIAAKWARLSALCESIPKKWVTDAAGMADAWKLRKAGEPLLHGLPGARKPLTFVEDNAVPVESLARFVREFRGIVERAGTRAAFWAHASVGVLHVRPMLDPRSPIDKKALIGIAVEVADLARDCGGIMSGEHGDGKVRGPLLERFFGAELMGAFREIKALFDPKGLLNPGNIVAPGRIESILERTRIEPFVPISTRPAPHVPQISTFYDYSAEEGFDHAIERCNGAGVCRKQSGGVMCPSYRATLDERHSTRGRGNALRLAITGQLTGGPETAIRFDDAETKKTLDLCLSCKACKAECPSNVDIAKLKAEYTAQGYAMAMNVPLSKQLVGHVRALNRLGAMTPRLSNWFSRSGAGRWLINRVMGIHPERSLPKFSKSLFGLAKAEEKRRLRRAAKPHAAVTAKRPKIVLFADCFTTYNESSIGLSAIRLLNELGYDVSLPSAGCCGRSMISVAMLKEGIHTADATLDRLREAIVSDEVTAVLFVEPSCLSSVKDDWLTLKCKTPIGLRKQLAAKAMLVEEFIDKHWDQHPDRGAIDRLSDASHRLGPAVLLHAHCHQKALWGAQSSAGALRRVVGDRLRVLPTGCCGMAGSFGYDRDKFELSMRIASLRGEGGEPTGGVLPMIQKQPDAIVLATGTSCRHQIHDGTSGQRHAAHPIEYLARMLGL